MPVAAGNSQHDSNSSSLPRSASYNHIPRLTPQLHNSDVKRTFSETNLPHSNETSMELDQESFAASKDILRQYSFRSPNGNQKAKGASFSLSAEEASTGDASNSRNSNSSETTDSPQRFRSVSGAIASLARKSWVSPRSPSPSPFSNDVNPTTGRTKESTSAKADAPVMMPAELIQRSPSQPVISQPSRKITVLSKRSRRPLSALAPKGKSELAPIPKSPSLQSLRSRASSDRLASFIGISNKEIPPVPQTPTGHLPQLNPDPPRKRDELWSVFRGLEADYQKFQSKSSALKANVVRSSLIPCLSRYAHHQSNQSLRPEDLDRRINILNKWWTGLLELLNGRNNQSLTGTDRPVFLEAIIGIMMRPEWRIPPFPASSPNTPSTTQNAASMSRSNTSLESTGSDFLIESIYHNIRNIFAQNLLSQMAYSVDRMSMRHTPASLVAFCGKTCAYAFFFCRGMADLLVRLWNSTPDILRRVLAEFEGDNNPSTRFIFSQDILSTFPPAVRSLSFTSHAALVRYLRQKVQPPLGTCHVNWYGPWVSRWSGRDTDLFFVFTKYFYILVVEFLPSDIDLSKRMYIPGLVSVHAQILTVLENTINKQSTPQSADNLHGAATTTFDDLIDNADASVAALPLGVANSLRVMSENRLVILLRDLLADPSVEPLTKQMYAKSFCGILKVAAQKISLFDHNSCFVLCDFVEELVSIVPRYCQLTRQPDLLDWGFWLGVCRQMMESHNSLTEVRVFSFIFSVWERMNSDNGRKESLCLDFLLRDSFFYRYFSHWSPMVRAYFHRLLCWRLARYHDAPSALDIRIYNTLSARLGNVWTYFLLSQSRAEKALSPPLSTAPCSPAPGRRIIIIRSDNHTTPSNLFVPFDCVGAPNSYTQPTAYRSHGSLRAIESSCVYEDNQPPQSKKRWRILKTMFSGPANPKPGEVTPPGSSSEESGKSIKSDTLTTPTTTPDSKGQLVELGDPRYTSFGSERSRTPHHPFSFRFSLEWIDRPKWSNKNKRLFAPCLPIPVQLFLQSQRKLAINPSDSGSGSVSMSVSGAGSDDGSESDGSDDSRQTDIPSTPATSPDASATTTTGNANVKRVTVLESIHPPENQRLIASKYAGRALAEWSQVVIECDGFFDRRREEGVPCDSMVEIPTLGVESFRK